MPVSSPCAAYLPVLGRGAVDTAPWGVLSAESTVSSEKSQKGLTADKEYGGKAKRLQWKRPICSCQGSALHVMLFLENLIRALLIFNRLRSRHCQRALLVYHYQNLVP